MSKLSHITTYAPYERVCLACGHVRPAIEYSSGRRTCNRCVDARMKGAQRISWKDQHTEYPLYNGAELRPFEGRPGAMDAFSLPSLRFGERVYWRGADLASPPAAADTERPKGK